MLVFRSVYATTNRLSHFQRLGDPLTACGQAVDDSHPARDAATLLGLEQCIECYRAMIAHRAEVERVLDATRHKLGPGYVEDTSPGSDLRERFNELVSKVGENATLVWWTRDLANFLGFGPDAGGPPLTIEQLEEKRAEIQAVTAVQARFRERRTSTVESRVVDL